MRYMKKVMIVLVFLGLLLSGGYFLNKKTPEKVNQDPVPTTTELAGGDRDVHGCIGSAGYTWCEAKNTCLREWEEPCEVNVKEEVQGILSQKYNKSSDETHITISKQDGNYAAGSVLFGEGGPGESGIFLARNNEGTWEVVFDGNGSVDCSKMREEYGFPDTILKPNFCD